MKTVADILKEFEEKKVKILSLSPKDAVKALLDEARFEFEGEEELLRKQAKKLRATEVILWLDDMLEIFINLSKK